jgi:hypothetical protein
MFIRARALNPLLPIDAVWHQFACHCYSLPDTTNPPMCCNNLETFQLVLSSTVLSMLATVLVVERHSAIANKVDSRGLVVVLSYRDGRIWI